MVSGSGGGEHCIPSQESWHNVYSTWRYDCDGMGLVNVKRAGGRGALGKDGARDGWDVH